MNCPSCGAPLRLAGGLTSLRCDYCRCVVPLAPDDEGMRYLDEVAELLCPVCAVPLWNATLANAPVHACKKCRGLLVAMGAFEGLVEGVRAQNPGGAMPAAGDDNELSRKLACPRCHRPMETHFYYGGGHVVMEDCERCEVNWLDSGAIKRIARAPQSESARESV